MARYTTIDFDWEEKTDYEKLLFILRLQHICRETECHIYRTHKGYHVYIRIDNYDFWKAIALRTYLLDDDARIWFDIMRHSMGMDSWTETLFMGKKDYHYEYREERISLDGLVKKTI